ncbi:hypothetical protein ACIXNR_22790, partial [Bacteroides fragilis]
MEKATYLCCIRRTSFETPLKTKSISYKPNFQFNKFHTSTTLQNLSTARNKLALVKYLFNVR